MAEQPPRTAGALDGVVVADFSRVLAGPYATMLLGDLGAEVVKVERPDGGDDTRAWGPPFAPSGEATYFLGVNRNKRSVAWDLTDPADLARARALAARADILVENMRPGGMDRLGLGAEQLWVDNPALVYVSISGFGSGAGAALPGYDLLVQAVGGLMSVTGPQPGSPTKVGVALVDVVTGLHAALGALAALRHAEATGQGQRVEVNLLSSLLSGLVNQTAGYAAAGVVPGILGNRHPSIAPYETVRTADRPLVLAVGNDRQFAALARVVDLPTLPADPRFATNTDRVAHREELVAALEEVLAGAGAEEWAARLTAAGVPCGPINDIADAVALAIRLGLDPVVTTAGVDTIAHPVRLSATPARYTRRPPALGADTDQVDAELGMAPTGDR